MARGSIVKRGKSCSIVYYVNGKQRWESVGQVTKKRAQEILRERMGEIDGGTYVPLANLKLTVKQFAEKWLETDAKTRRWSTLANYRSRLKHVYDALKLDEPGDLPLSHLTPERIDRLRADLLARLSTVQAGNVLKMFKRCLRMAVKWRYLRYNPAADLEQPRAPRARFTPPDIAQIHALLDELRQPKYEPDAYALTFTAVMTGMRRGELNALEWADLDLDRGWAKVQRSYSASRLVAPKTESGCRSVPLPPSVVNLLRARQLTATGPRIFPGPKGGYLNFDKFTRRNLRPALIAVGLPRMSFHKLRHVYASLLGTMVKTDPKTLQANMGHASPLLSMTVYTHTTEQQQVDAARELDSLLSRPLAAAPPRSA